MSSSDEAAHAPAPTTHATYTNLVQDENDLIGLIAYSLYKSDKLAFVKQHTSRLGRAPNDEEMMAFCHTLNLPGQVSSLRNKAEVLLEELNEQVLDVTIAEIQKDYEAKLVAELRRAKPFWKSVGENLIANVLAAALTVLLVVLVYGAQIGYLRLAGDVFGYEVREKSRAATAP